MGLLDEMKEKETKDIGLLLIIEVIGKPPEHLTETLKNIVTNIDNEKGVKVLSRKINEPREMEKQKGFYSSFVEVEVEVEEILYVAMLIYKYMPAHIEIVYPEFIALTSLGWNEVFNELVGRLHGYDEVARLIQYEKKILEKKLKDILSKNQINEEGKEKKIVPMKNEKIERSVGEENELEDDIEE